MIILLRATFCSRRVPEAPLNNNLDEVHSWMQLHRPSATDDRESATDDRECGNLEFLCTLNTPSPERMRYLLNLCKDKKTAHLRRTLLETQDLLRIPLSFWEGVNHQTNRGGWWVRALSEVLTLKCGKCKRWASPPAGQGRMHQLQGKHTSKAGLAQEEKGGQNQAPADTGLAMRSALPEEFEKICHPNLISDSTPKLPHIQCCLEDMM